MPIGHPVFWILVVALLAPLLAEIPVGFKVPVVVLEVVLGMVIGPHVLDLVQFEGFVAVMHTIGMAMTLFMAISFTLDRASRRTCPAKRRGRSAVPGCGGFDAARARKPSARREASQNALKLLKEAANRWPRIAPATIWAATYERLADARRADPC